MRLLPSLLVAAALCFGHAGATASHSDQIRGAEIELVPKTIDVDLVTIENRGSTPVVAWEVGFPEGGTVNGADFTTSELPARVGEGPIQPGERRRIDLPDFDGQPVGVPTIMLAVWADGALAGTAASVERWLRSRRERLEDASYWTRVFELMPQDDDARARGYLAAFVAERSGQAPADPSRTRAMLGELWAGTGRRSQSVFPVVARIHRQLERERTSLTHLLASSRVLDTPAAIVASERTTRTEYSACVTNRYGSPIEALAFGVLQGGTHVTSQVTDYCLSDPSRPNGRIAPGETRQLHVAAGVHARSDLPMLRLSLVLYDDLTFEGSPEERDRVLRSREQRADELAFVNEMRRALASVPDDALQEFLAAKRAERTRHLLASGRRPEQMSLDSFMAEVKRFPSQVRDTAPFAIATVEEQIRRLLRHQR